MNVSRYVVTLFNWYITALFRGLTIVVSQYTNSNSIDTVMNLPIKIIISIAVCLGLGFFSGYYGGSADTEWYQGLNKPFFQPPPQVFGPAWTLLYSMMGVAFALVWHGKEVSGGARGQAITFFFFQVALNLLWTPIFFKVQAPRASLVVIINLIIVVIFTLSKFKKVDVRAFWLMVPYLCWLIFATALNAAIVYLN